MLNSEQGDDPLVRTPEDSPQFKKSEEMIHSAVQIGNVDSNFTEGVIVTDLEDEEIGNFVSISGIGQDSMTGTSQVNHSVIKPDGNTTKESSGQVHQNVVICKQEEKSNNPSSNPTSFTFLSPGLNEVAENCSFGPELNVTGGSVDEGSVTSDQSQTKGAKESYKVTTKSPIVERLSLKNQGKASKGGKKITKKEKNKEKIKKNRDKVEAHDRIIDDNHSEVSYQPDTDLSRSKASKKINGKNNKWKWFANFYEN